MPEYEIFPSPITIEADSVEEAERKADQIGIDGIEKIIEETGEA